MLIATGSCSRRNLGICTYAHAKSELVGGRALDKLEERPVPHEDLFGTCMHVCL